MIFDDADNEIKMAEYNAKVADIPFLITKKNKDEECLCTICPECIEIAAAKWDEREIG